jgi:hypothetical protein
MSSFRRAFYVLSETAGSYVNGEYVPGARTTATIQASVQPVKMGEDVEALPEGRRLSDYLKAYTSTKLKITEEGSNVQPDLIVWPESGWAYEITSQFIHQMGVIPHYKYVAEKRIKITTNVAALLAGWIAGTIQR